MPRTTYRPTGRPGGREGGTEREREKASERPRGIRLHPRRPLFSCRSSKILFAACGGEILIKLLGPLLSPLSVVHEATRSSTRRRWPTELERNRPTKLGSPHLAPVVFSVSSPRLTHSLRRAAPRRRLASQPVKWRCQYQRQHSTSFEKTCV